MRFRDPNRTEYETESREILRINQKQQRRAPQNHETILGFSSI